MTVVAVAVVGICLDFVFSGDLVDREEKENLVVEMVR